MVDRKREQLVLTEEEEKAIEFLREIVVVHRDMNGPHHNALLIKSLMMGITMLIDPNKLKDAYGAIPAETDRRAHLLALADRLELVDGLFEMADPHGSPGSLWAAAQEARAVAHGDAPRTFKQLPSQGKRSSRLNTYRLAHHQVRALAWAELFRERGVAPSAYQGQIALAFGETWETIRKWRSKLRERLGSAEVDERIWFASSISSPWRRLSDEQIDTLLTKDGKAYRTELWQQAGSAAQE